MAMTPEEREEALTRMVESFLGGKVDKERVEKIFQERLKLMQNRSEPSSSGTSKLEDK